MLDIGVYIEIDIGVSRTHLVEVVPPLLMYPRSSLFVSGNTHGIHCAHLVEVVPPHDLVPVVQPPLQHVAARGVMDTLRRPFYGRAIPWPRHPMAEAQLPARRRCIMDTTDIMDTRPSYGRAILWPSHPMAEALPPLQHVAARAI